MTDGLDLVSPMVHKKSPLKATRLHKHKRNVRIGKTVGVVVILGLVIFLVWKLVRLPVFMISQISVEVAGQENSPIQTDSTAVSVSVPDITSPAGSTNASGIASTILPADIQAVAANDLSGTYRHFFPKANRLWYPRNVISQNILNDFPSIDSVFLGPQGGTLIVTVEERQPAYLWCPGNSPFISNQGGQVNSGGSVNSASSIDSADLVSSASSTLLENQTDLGGLTNQTNMPSGCYLADANGYIFGAVTATTPLPMANASGGDFLILYGAVGSTTAASVPANPVGQTYANPGDFKNIIAFANDLTMLGLKVVSVASEGSGVYDIYLDQPGRIIFKASDDPSILESDIATLMANDGIFSPNGGANGATSGGATSAKTGSKNGTTSGNAHGTSTLDYVDLRFGDKVYYKFVGQ